MEEKKRNDPAKKPKRPKKKVKPIPVPEPPMEYVPPRGPLPTDLEALSAVLSVYEPSPSEAKHRQNMKHMGDQLQEYLSNFILIGYTLDGKAVNITYSPTSKDWDSLNAGLHRYIIEGPHSSKNFLDGPGNM